MFFYVDESGNTGNNLFDSSQPILSYGVLSSKLNPDVLAKSAHAAMLRKLSVDCLHANQLGVSRLTAIMPTLVKLQQRFQFRFDYYYIHKPTYALVILFDAIFDAGINPAVKWDLYWTPLRFPAIHKLSLLCDQELLENAWSLCIARDVDKRTTEIVALLTELRERSKTSNMDHRTKELFDAAFGYGVANPQALDFGATDQKIYSPNATGFQFVLSSMARRLRAANRKDALSIKVDRQSEFNASQASAHYVQRLGPVNTTWPDYVTFQVWNLPKLNTNALRRICHYSAETSGFLTAKCSTPSCMSPNRDASGAGCRPGLETGTPSTPE